MLREGHIQASEGASVVARPQSLKARVVAIPGAATQITRSCAPSSSDGVIGAAAPIGGSFAGVAITAECAV